MVHRGYIIKLYTDESCDVYKGNTLKIRASCVEDAHDWIDRQWARKSAHFDRDQHRALQAGRAT